MRKQTGRQMSEKTVGLSLNEKLKNYARLLVRSGCGISPEQKPVLLINASTAATELVRLVTKEAYAAGAKRVFTKFSDDVVTRLTYDNCPVEEFETVPEWAALQNNQLAEEGAAFLSILSEDPTLMSGVDPAKLQASVMASHTACKPFYDALNFGKNVWCIAACASEEWAAKVFPDLALATAKTKLWDAILTSARADGKDPIAAWAAHRASFDARKAWLNEQHFELLHYSNALGTDITIYLPETHIWNGGGDVTIDGLEFFPNMPTEEVFTTPHLAKTSGIVHSALPLSFFGSMVEDFWIRFDNGRAVEFGAKVGEDVLASIIEADEGAHYLGEVALVPYSSPIRQAGVLFYNTLFDENASCHFALGKGFPDCAEGGQEMSTEELKAAGVNDSAMHVDFMIGTFDLSVVGRKADGSEVAIFKDGDWAF